MCNLNEEENIGHFIAISPILAELRRLYFVQSKLSEEIFFMRTNMSDIRRRLSKKLRKGVLIKGFS